MREHRETAGYREYKLTLKDRMVAWLVGRNKIGPPDGPGYTVRVAECHRFLDWHAIPDPFIRTTITPSGWKVALLVLLGWYELEVTVSADGPGIEKVLELNPDYLGAQGSERRKAWNVQLNQALGDFAEGLPE